jgi:hypothetical protein
MALIVSQFLLDWIFLLESLVEDTQLLKLWPLFILGPLGHRIGFLFFMLKRYRNYHISKEPSYQIYQPEIVTVG